jgi:hypothetical protein
MTTFPQSHMPERWQVVNIRAISALTAFVEQGAGELRLAYDRSRWHVRTEPTTSCSALRTTSPTRSSVSLGTLSDLSELHAAHQLGEARSPWTRDALLESWTIHLRNVLQFLRSEGARPSDIVAEDYIADWCHVLFDNPGRRAAREMGLVKDPDEQRLVWRVNKEIVHLTYDRLDISLDNRLWPVGAVSQHLGRDLQVFVDHVVPELVERSFFDRVEAALGAFTFSVPNRP